MVEINCLSDDQYNKFYKDMRVMQMIIYDFYVVSVAIMCFVWSYICYLHTNKTRLAPPTWSICFSIFSFLVLSMNKDYNCVLLIVLGELNIVGSTMMVFINVSSFTTKYTIQSEMCNV